MINTKWDDKNSVSSLLRDIKDKQEDERSELEKEIFLIVEQGLGYYKGITDDFFVKDGHITVVTRGIAEERGRLFEEIVDPKEAELAANSVLAAWWPQFTRQDIGTENPVSSFSLTSVRYEFNIDSMGSVSIAVRHLLKDIKDAVGDEQIIEEFSKLYATKRILVCGIPGSGKTTFVNRVLASPTGPKVRRAIIQDVLEIKPLPTDYSAVAEYDSQGIYIKSSMRQTPTVLIVGEIRTVEIVLQTLSSMLLTSGGLTTFHSNSAYNAMKRIKIMLIMASGMDPRAAEEIIQLSLDKIVVLDNTRVIEIKEVSEVLKELRLEEARMMNECE